VRLSIAQPALSKAIPRMGWRWLSRRRRGRRCAAESPGARVERARPEAVGRLVRGGGADDGSVRLKGAG